MQRLEAIRAAEIGPGAPAWGAADIEPRQLNTLLHPESGEMGRTLAARGQAAFEAAFALFARDPHWRAEGVPLRGFLSQWAKYLAKVAANGGAPAPRRLTPEEADALDDEEERRAQAQLDRERSRLAAEGGQP